MSKAKTVKEVLIAAKWMLEHVGWIQGKYMEKGADGNPIAFCASEALNRVIPTNRDLRDRAQYLLSLHMDGGSIIGFNDDLGRTKEQVLAAFDKAIEASKGMK